VNLHKTTRLFCALLLAGCAQSPPAPTPEVGRPPLKPDAPEMKKQAPELYKVRVTTSQGDFTITVHRPWAPKGADRFYNLVRGGFYDEARFFRVLKGFVCQFGMHADPAVSALWKDANIPDDPVIETNTRGRVTFATGGPNTRTTQLFINFNNKNTRLDGMGFSPFGEVTDGMDVVEKFYADYGEGEPSGAGPSQDRISSEGNAYLKSGFPKLDYIKKAILEDR
jgi:peptidyl-prolyl cis-trans isomerase A (cyclophilin A)